MKSENLHSEWLSLIDVSGPFLAEPVLKDAFPQGLEAVDAEKRRTLRQAYDEWREALELEEPELPAIHRAWIDLVLRQGLELDEDGKGDVFRAQADLPATVRCDLPERGVVLRPDFAVVDLRHGNEPMMLVSVYAPFVALDDPLKADGWNASPAERMVELCRAAGVRLGLVTNGERWMFIDAPVGAVTSFASWYANLWSQEPKTLQSFVNLLGVRRFFVDRSQQLPALLDESLKLQDEVTDALGEQVRRAVEVLIQSLDRANVDRNYTLLEGVEPAELYEAALTVMMRIVFLLSAEERGLLLMGDECYEANYAVSTLRMQLRAETEEILERRWDAWSRLLAVFRAVYGGIDHEALRLPALGGSLFDPDRFPFLEGRSKGSSWKADLASPLPIDNRTVLLLLDAVQLFQGRTLSYRALDVEQIGYVYEGLLERTVVRAKEVTLDLKATKSAKKPWVTLDELEAAATKSAAVLSELLKERAASSASRVANDLVKKVEEADADRLLTVCHGDQQLRDRIRPFFHLLRTDRWEYPLVYPVGTFMVTTGADRRETGTHYTPKSLTEAVVKETLEPIVYGGPAEGKPREEWQLKSPDRLLDLKICDPAMGSGAFLVQVCRWLSERLVEAWEQSERAGNAVTAEGVVVEKINGYEPLRSDPEERQLTARRLIAERCLYGVDVNPLAVELAKLSIWLVTLAKHRPFGFLDHNLRTGDSLLGIHDLDQLLYLEIKPGKGSSKKLFAGEIDKAAEEAVALRTQLRSRAIRDIRDVKAMASLDERARAKLQLPELIADALISDTLAASGRNVDNTSLSIEAGQALKGDSSVVQMLRRRTLEGLSIDLRDKQSARRPLHWALEFPEVFTRELPGFDACVSNPPYLGGRKIRAVLGGAYLAYLTNSLFPKASGNADLCAFFIRRATILTRKAGVLGMVASSSISEGDTREVGLEAIIRDGGSIIRASSKTAWPGQASVTISPIWVYNGSWNANRYLNNTPVRFIDASLGESDGSVLKPERLKENIEFSFQGSIPLGKGFIISDEERDNLLSADPRNRDVILPYLVGQELNIDPEHTPSKWIINFFDWPLDRSTAANGYVGPVASDYPGCLEILKNRVLPERTRKKPNGEYVLRKPLPQKWWLYGDKRPKLYSKLKQSNWALAVATGATKYVAFGRVSGEKVYSHSIVVVPSDDWGFAAALASNMHEVWARQYASYNLLLLRYTPTDVFDTFPFPIFTEKLRDAGRKYYLFREELMRRRAEGLTKLYNHFHEKSNTQDEIVTLRELQVALDAEVYKSYGWSTENLTHDFFKTEQGQRFTISPQDRGFILRELLNLNHLRHATVCRTDPW